VTPRFSARREVAIGLAAYAAYLLVRRVSWNDAGRERARANAERLVAVERRVQDAALRQPRLVHALNVGYGAFNVGLTLGLLHRRYGRRDPGYHRLRRQAILAHAGALPVFLFFPTAPPRTLSGFVDTMQEISRIDLEHPLLVRLYNPLAAMPSQHMSMAVVTGAALADRASTRRGRLAAHSYAPVVGAVVVATGNHYVLDVAAGAALGVFARKLA
jgi:membrane-associated phospholipid phosphatase